MYAVIRTGGKQYKVSEGETFEVEYLSVKGDKVTFEPILVVTDDGKTIYGRKDLKPYTVTARLLGETKGDKIDVFKYRPKSGYAVKRGHRQLHSVIEITSIGTKESKKPKEDKEPEEPEEEEVRAAPSPKEEKESRPPKGEAKPAAKRSPKPKKKASPAKTR